MTTYTTDRADSGEIPRYDSLGDDPTRNLAAERDLILASTHRLRLDDPTCDIPVVEDDEPTMRQHLDAGFAQPIAPLERVITGELSGPQIPPTPDPVPPPPPPTPAKRSRTGYVGRHRQAVQGTSWWPLVGYVVAGVLIVLGLLVMPR